MSDKMRTFDTGATRNDDSKKPDYRGILSWSAIRRYGEYMVEHRVQADGTLRDSDNWKKGIPMKEFISSLMRHTVDLTDEFDSRTFTSDKEIEDLACAIIFNAQGFLHEFLKAKETFVIHHDLKVNIAVPLSSLSSFPTLDPEEIG